MSLLSLAREGGGRDGRSADLRPACQPDASRRASSPDGGGIPTDLLPSPSFFGARGHLHHHARNARGSHPSGMPCAGMKSASHAVHPHLALRERGQPSAPALRDFIFNCSSPCEDARAVAGALSILASERRDAPLFGSLQLRQPISTNAKIGNPLFSTTWWLRLGNSAFNTRLLKQLRRPIRAPRHHDSTAPSGSQRSF